MADDTFDPDYLILHDVGGQGGQYIGDNPEKSPYHAIVYPDGSVVYRNPQDPYGKQAPHAYGLNPRAVGIAYAGDVGSQPTPEAMLALRGEVSNVQSRYPGIDNDHIMSHGEAYAATKGTRWQASKAGRGMDEASWREQIRNPTPAGQPAPDAPAAAPFAGTESPYGRPVPPPPFTVADDGRADRPEPVLNPDAVPAPQAVAARPPIRPVARNLASIGLDVPTAQPQQQPKQPVSPFAKDTAPVGSSSDNGMAAAQAAAAAGVRAWSQKVGQRKPIGLSPLNDQLFAGGSNGMG